MSTVSIIPYIPRTITVHLGQPDAYAANVTVPFSEYVKNVASSEVYPTWDESALRANILAITSFALNRFYTEYYRSRGYNFDITSATEIDQKFINGRNFFDTISELADSLFTSYIRRVGFIEPLAAKFCNGTTVTCAGLSQWGSQELAQQGLGSVQILRRYYGNNIEIVSNAPVRGYTPSYPGTPLRYGSRGAKVLQAQIILNTIGKNYPAIPRINPEDGIFGPQTEAAVLTLQRIFNLTPDGVIGRSTWNQMEQLYVAVKRLNELESLGQTYISLDWQAPDSLQEGSRGQQVRQLQYMLQVLSDYISTVPRINNDGIFGPRTEAAVTAYQAFAGLTPDGVVGPATWNSMRSRVSGILGRTEASFLQYPGQPLRRNDRDQTI